MTKLKDLTPRNFKKGEIDPTVRAYFPDAPQELFDFAYKFSDVRSLHKRFSAAKAIWQGRTITRAMLEELQFQFETGEREDK